MNFINPLRRNFKLITTTENAISLRSKFILFICFIRIPKLLTYSKPMEMGKAHLYLSFPDCASWAEEDASLVHQTSLQILAQRGLCEVVRKSEECWHGY